MYALFLKEGHGYYPAEASIFSLTDVKQLSYPLSSQSHNMEDICNLFKGFLEQLLGEIFDSEQSFEHNEESKYCNYCE
jgi:hypothetical protein